MKTTTKSKSGKITPKNKVRNGVTRKGAGQGMNWITQHKRLSVYLRDGLACAYCGDGIEDGVCLSLDHLVACSQGGSHHESNLITSCFACNSSRKDMPFRKFVKKVAIQTGRNATKIVTFVENAVDRPLDIAEAKEIIERRGTCRKALDFMASLH